jgi:hypothetical protein
MGMATIASQSRSIPEFTESPAKVDCALAAWHEHDCLHCGQLVSPLQEAMGEGMLILLRGAGPCTPLYCQSCLHAILLDE